MLVIEAFLNSITGIFGAVAWYTYSIEFQQRGPPHMHCIISLVNHVKTTKQVDAICSAVIPVLPAPNDPMYETMKILRKCVEESQIHCPCDKDMSVS